MLTMRDVAPYLLDLKLVSPAAVVDGELTVTEVSRRNRNFRVEARGGPSYLLKQGGVRDGMPTLANEAAVYQRLQSAGRRSRVARCAPKFYGYDATQNVLILELLPSTQDLRDYHATSRRFSTRVARALGAGLAAFHSATRQPETAPADTLLFSGLPPWPLSLHRPGLPFLREVSAANLQLIRLIQSLPDFARLLDELRGQWGVETLVHNDVKWDNFLVCRSGARGRGVGVRIVDWEMAGTGDPCWDAGGVFGGYLGFWLLSLPATGEEPPERWTELTRYPLRRMQPAMRAFWAAYSAGMGWAADEASGRLLRCVRYAAVRLMQTAYESLQASLTLTGGARIMLQLTLNILRRPHEAAVHLLGIPLTTSWTL